MVTNSLYLENASLPSEHLCLDGFGIGDSDTRQDGTFPSVRSDQTWASWTTRSKAGYRPGQSIHLMMSSARSYIRREWCILRVSCLENSFSPLGDGWSMFPHWTVFQLISRHRWFETAAPSGILQPGTNSQEGIYSGKDSKDFVWPQQLQADEKRFHEYDTDDYPVLAAKMQLESWTNDFAGNECRSLSRHEFH